MEETQAVLVVDIFCTHAFPRKNVKNYLLLKKSLKFGYSDSKWIFLQFWSTGTTQFHMRFQMFESRRTVHGIYSPASMNSWERTVPGWWIKCHPEIGSYRVVMTAYHDDLKLLQQSLFVLENVIALNLFEDAYSCVVRGAA